MGESGLGQDGPAPDMVTQGFPAVPALRWLVTTVQKSAIVCLLSCFSASPSLLFLSGASRLTHPSPAACPADVPVKFTQKRCHRVSNTTAFWIWVNRSNVDLLGSHVGFAGRKHYWPLTLDESPPFWLFNSRSTHSPPPPPPLPPPLVIAPPDWGGVLAGEWQLCPDACTLPCFYTPSLEENCCFLVNVCPALPMFLFPPEPHFKHMGYNSTLSKPVVFCIVSCCVCLCLFIPLYCLFIVWQKTRQAKFSCLKNQHNILFFNHFLKAMFGEWGKVYIYAFDSLQNFLLHWAQHSLW